MIAVNIRCSFFYLGEGGAISCVLGMKPKICYIKMLVKILKIK